MPDAALISQHTYSNGLVLVAEAMPGVQWLVKNHRDLIDAEIGLNEGGDIIVSKDLSKVESVQMAVGEKTYKSFKLQTKGTGGHSSVPQMARAFPGFSVDVLSRSRAPRRWFWDALVLRRAPLRA